MFFLEINYKHAEMEIVDMLPFTIALKKIKHLGINLAKEVKNLYNERQTSEKKKNEDTRIWKKYPTLVDWQSQHCTNEHFTKSFLKIQCIFHSKFPYYFVQVIEN